MPPSKATTNKLNNLVTKFEGQALDMILNGATEQKILFTILELGAKDKCSMDEAKAIYISAKKQLASDYDRDREFTIANHINRYNKEIKKLFNVDYTQYNKWKAAEMKNFAYFNLLEVLMQKEKILGLHSKLLHIKINNETNIKTVTTPIQLNLGQLTLAEKIELYHLLQEGEVDQENMSIIPSTRVKEVKADTEDIDHIEIIDNINFVKNKPLGVIKEIDRPNTLLSLEEKLKLSNLKLFEQNIKNAKTNK